MPCYGVIARKNQLCQIYIERNRKPKCPGRAFCDKFGADFSSAWIFREEYLSLLRYLIFGIKHLDKWAEDKSSGSKYEEPVKINWKVSLGHLFAPARLSREAFKF